LGLPPSPWLPPSVCGSSSGTARTAQRTSINSATTGIFKMNISQMKVQVPTASIVLPDLGVGKSGGRLIQIDLRRE
jgi:hypothetical protein